MYLVIWDKINPNNKILQGKIRNTIGKVENITIINTNALTARIQSIWEKARIWKENIIQ